MRKKIKLLLILIWMAFIFFMSSLTGSESSNTSHIFLDLMGFLGVDINSSLGEFFHFLIRKGAHLFEYFVLALLIYNYMREFTISHYTLTVPVIVSFLYACTDEWHQTFVSNRSGSIVDVGIDTLGSIVAMVFTLVIIKWLKK